MSKELAIMLAVGVLLGLAACGPSSSLDPAAEGSAWVEDPLPAAPEVAPTSPEAGPAGADTMTWIYDRQGEEGRPRLVYADPQNGETVIRLECVIGGAIYVYLDRPAPAGERPEDWPFTLIGGDLQSSSPGDTVAKDARLEVIGAFPITDDVLGRFRRDGTMSVSDSVLSTPMPVDAIDLDERAMAKRFFAACEGS